MVGSPCSPRDSQESSPTPQIKSINSSVLSFLSSPTLTSNMTTGKTIALGRRTFVGKVMSLLFNMPVFLPGKSHGWRSLVGCSPWGHEESDMTERLHFHFSLSCIGEGKGNPLQCSFLENPRDKGAWWAAISGVAQSWTELVAHSSFFSLAAALVQ